MKVLCAFLFAVGLVFSAQANAALTNSQKNFIIKHVRAGDDLVLLDLLFRGEDLTGDQSNGLYQEIRRGNYKSLGHAGLTFWKNPNIPYYRSVRNKCAANHWVCQ